MTATHRCCGPALGPLSGLEHVPIEAVVTQTLSFLTAPHCNQLAIYVSDVLTEVSRCHLTLTRYSPMKSQAQREGTVDVLSLFCEGCRPHLDPGAAPSTRIYRPRRL